MGVPEEGQKLAAAGDALEATLRCEIPRLLGLAERLTGERREAVFVEIRRVAVPRGSLGALPYEDGVLLKADWERAIGGGKTTMRCFGSGHAGRTIELRAIETQRVVTDNEGVSGGTTMALVEVRDPITEEVASGIDFQVRASPLAASERVVLEVSGVAGKTDTKERLRAKMSGVTADATASLSPGPPGQPPVAAGPASLKAVLHEAELTVPRQTCDRFTVSLAIPPGRDVVLDVRAGAGDTAQVLIGSVRIAKP